MRLRSVHPGDRIKANVKGVSFTCTVEKKTKAYVLIKDPEPSWVTWKFLGPRMVREKI